MTYVDYEESVALGQPIELFDIAMGSTHWRLTSGDEDVTYNTYLYLAEPCSRTEIEQTGEIPKDGVDIHLPRGNSLGTLCIAGVPDAEVTLTIYRGHGSNFITFFQGFMTSLKFNSDSIPIAHFEPRSSDLPYVGGRRRAMRLCGHRLFSTGCGLDKDNFSISGTIATISGTTISATAFSTSPYDHSAGGEIVVGTARRTILTHSTSTITINRPFSSSVIAGASFTSYAGCNHTPETCLNTFNNKANYGGQEYLPVQNLYESEIHE